MNIQCCWRCSISLVIYFPETSLLSWSRIFILSNPVQDEFKRSVLGVRLSVDQQVDRGADPGTQEGLLVTFGPTWMDRQLRSSFFKGDGLILKMSFMWNRCKGRGDHMQLMKNLRTTRQPHDKSTQREHNHGDSALTSASQEAYKKKS